MTSVRRNSEPPAKCLNMFYVIIRMPTNLPFNILAYRLVNLVKIGHVNSRKRMAKNRNLSYRRQALKEILVCRNNALRRLHVNGIIILKPSQGLLYRIIPDRRPPVALSLVLQEISKIRKLVIGKITSLLVFKVRSIPPSVLVTFHPSLKAPFAIDAMPYYQASISVMPTAMNIPYLLPPDTIDRLQKISIIERQEPGILVDIKQTLLKPLLKRQRVNPLMQLIPHFKRARVEHVRNAVQPQIIVAISEPIRIFVTIRQDNIKNIEHLLPVQVSQMLFKPPPQIVLGPCYLWVYAAR